MDYELVLGSFVGVEGLAFWHFEGSFFLLVAEELLLLLEMLAPTPERDPVIAFVGF